jgi:hypothetical protein
MLGELNPKGTGTKSTPEKLIWQPWVVGTMGTFVNLIRAPW